MKTLSEFIKEELDDNVLWLLDKWFDNNEEQKTEFISIISNFGSQRSINVKELSSFIEQMSIYKHIREFVNFIDNDLDPETTKDYLYAFKNIIEYVINNQSKRSKKYKVGS